MKTIRSGTQAKMNFPVKIAIAGTAATLAAIAAIAYYRAHETVAAKTEPTNAPAYAETMAREPNPQAIRSTPAAPINNDTPIALNKVRLTGDIEIIRAETQNAIALADLHRMQLHSKDANTQLDAISRIVPATNRALTIAARRLGALDLVPVESDEPDAIAASKKEKVEIKSEIAKLSSIMDECATAVESVKSKLPKKQSH